MYRTFKYIHFLQQKKRQTGTNNLRGNTLNEMNTVRFPDSDAEKWPLVLCHRDREVLDQLMERWKIRCPPGTLTQGQPLKSKSSWDTHPISLQLFLKNTNSQASKISGRYILRWLNNSGIKTVSWKSPHTQWYSPAARVPARPPPGCGDVRFPQGSFASLSLTPPTHRLHICFQSRPAPANTVFSSKALKGFHGTPDTKVSDAARKPNSVTDVFCRHHCMRLHWDCEAQMSCASKCICVFKSRLWRAFVLWK